MPDEIQDSPKLPNLNEEERMWLSVMLIDEKPSEVYELFLEEFPRLAEYADEHGIPDEKLKPLIIRRFYEINKQKNRDYAEFMGNLSNRQFSSFTNGAVLYHMLTMRQVKRIHRENAAASENRNMSEEEQKHLEKRNKFVNENIKRAIQLNKVARDKVKFDILTQNKLSKEDADPVQLKQTQTPGETDWAARARERAERIKSGEENLPD